MAENLNDSLVAPLAWYAVFGLPGAAVYRFANTADAMWGYRGRYEWAGKWAARADDVLSWVPARITAALLLGWRPGAWSALVQEARDTSPNGGWPMGAMALHLGVRLTKPGVYRLNDSAPAPDALALRKALHRASVAAWAAMALAAAMLFAKRAAVVSRMHGGPDASGAARWDFSTNANAAGPCPHALEALRRADPSRYPDPGYHRLRERLAAWHGVDVSRIVIAASASEFIQRITAVGARLAPGPVQVPRHAYGDYAAAARAHGRPVIVEGAAPTLRWCADPSSPLGQDSVPPNDLPLGTTVLDAVYAPLRLEGRSAWSSTARDAVFELVSPNKALGLPGVRAAYAIAPRDGGRTGAPPLPPPSPRGRWALTAWRCSKPGSAMARRSGWPNSFPGCAKWEAAASWPPQAAGAEVQPSVTPFVCARLPAGATPQALRTCGIAVRDAASFGLPAWVRLSAQPPASVDALRQALHELTSKCGFATLLEPPRGGGLGAARPWGRSETTTPC